MLALLAAVAAATAPASKMSVAAAPDARLIVLQAEPRFSHLRSPACRRAGRLETAFEPALLYRQEDRDAGQLRKLIDLPEAKACLLGGTVPDAAPAGETR